MKYILVIYTLFFVTALNAQDKWLISDIKTETESFYPKDIIPIVNQDNNSIALFFTNRKVIFGKLYNNKKELIGTLNNIKIPKKGKIIIGAIYNNQNYTIFFSNNNKTHFSTVTVNFETRDFSITEDLEIELKKEKILEFLIRKNKLHILSVSKNSDILKIRTLTSKGVSDTFDFDLSNQTITDNLDKDYPLYPLLYGNPNYSTVEIINNEVPNSLEQSNAFTKLYLNENNLIITNNIFNKFTYIITLDLENKSYTFQSLKNKGFGKNQYGSNSNSFIFNDKLFTIYSTLDSLNFSAYKLKKLEFLKSFKIIKGQKIDFKNTPIIQEGGEFDSYRELEKTSKFLRKVTQSKIAITGYTKNNNLIITIGASKEIQTSSFGMMNFGLIGGLAYGLLTNYYNYSRTKSTRISCLFDQDLNHKTGVIPLNIFDKIQDFKLKNKKINTTYLETLFKFNSSLLLGNYNKKDGRYTLYKFD
ncbi:hypothetical protein [Olleya sp. R77988]|uniref:hypothetical protein n=1 Tax=Olleya sp. R77988 TaxID=3093875 RepID=UPI0037C56C10